MNLATAFAAATLCAVLGGTPAWADAIADIKKRGTIRFGYSETSAPFSFKGKEGVPVGYSVELCKRVAAGIQAAAGAGSLKLEWVPLTPATRLEAVASGKVDVECGTTTATLARREKVDFSLPIFLDSASIMARRSTASTVPELQGRKVAAAEGTTTLAAIERGLAKRFVKAEIVKVRTVAEGFEALKAGKVDALAGDRTALVGSFLLGGGAEGLTVLAEEFSYEPYALVLPRGDAALRLAVDRVLAQLYRSGEIEAVYTQWLAPLGRPTPALLAMYMVSAIPE